MLTIAAFTLAAAQPAPTATTPATDWRPLGIVRERYRLAWDAASIVRGPDVVSVRFRTEAAQSPETSEHLMSRVEIRCRDSLVRVVETVTYAADGSVVRRDTVPPAFAPIPADSHVAAIQRQVC
jgi:hypothetical protein